MRMMQMFSSENALIAKQFKPEDQFIHPKRPRYFSLEVS